MRIVDEKLLDQFRGPGICEWCKKRVSRREPHHIFCRGMGSANRLDVRQNLVALCAAFSGGDDCHRNAHNGHRPFKCNLLALVAAREGVLQADLEAELLRLRRIEGKPKRWKHRRKK